LQHDRAVSKGKGFEKQDERNGSDTVEKFMPMLRISLLVIFAIAAGVSASRAADEPQSEMTLHSIAPSLL
jgi:hypothetical protein